MTMKSPLQQSNSLEQWLSYIEGSHGREIDLGLQRVLTLAKQHKLTQFSCPVISIAGTNGKGSSVALLEAILVAAGLRVASYTSPHLLKFNERIRINAEPVSDASLCTAFATIEKMRSEVSLSYFEFTTMAALHHFQQANVDVVLLEVGLGGRLDAVNVVDADLALITSIDFDHQDWLGDSLEAIAFEKVGIARAGQTVIFGDSQIAQSALQYAKLLNCQCFQRGVDYDYQQQTMSWHWQSQRNELSDLPLPTILLQNAANVLMAVEWLQQHLTIPAQAIIQGLKTVNPTARCQIVSEEPTVLLDVAHNPQACQQLATRLQTLPQQGRTLAVFSMLKGKDLLASIDCFKQIVDVWYCADLPEERGIPVEQIAENLTQQAFAEVIVCDSVATAFKQAQQVATSIDRIVVFGSFYTVAEVLSQRC